MEELLESVRRIVAKYTNTSTALTAGASIGDTLLEVASSKRFSIGDEVMLRSPTRGETGLTIEEIPSETQILLASPLQFNWSMAQNPVLDKLFYGQAVQHIYLGEPENIPRFPAITVNAVNRNSQPLTIDSWKEDYRIQITVYVEDAMQERGYRFLLKLVDAIQKGLKKNIYPMVGPYDTVAATADISENDTFIKVQDTTNFEYLSRIWVEDPFKVEEKRVMSVVDGTTLQVSPPFGNEFSSENTTVIKLKRFIFNSWPENIEYGKIFKGTLLKAATIDWFAWEEELHDGPPEDVQLS